MNETVLKLFDNYLTLTGNEAAAASLTLADTLQCSLDAKAAPAATMLTVDEAAVRLHLCSKKVYNMCRAGELPSVKVGRVVRIPIEEIERLEANTRTIKAPPRLTGRQHF